VFRSSFSDHPCQWCPMLPHHRGRVHVFSFPKMPFFVERA
jgi:hypothetical protein